MTSKAAPANLRGRAEEFVRSLLKVQALVDAGNEEQINAKRAYAKVFYPMNGFFEECRKLRAMEPVVPLAAEVSKTVRRCRKLQSNELFALCKCWLTYVGIDVRKCLESDHRPPDAVVLARIGFYLLESLLDFDSKFGDANEVAVLACKITAIACTGLAVSHQLCGEVAKYAVHIVDRDRLGMSLDKSLGSVVGHGLLAAALSGQNHDRMLAVLSNRTGSSANALRFFVGLGGFLQEIQKTDGPFSSLTVRGDPLEMDDDNCGLLRDVFRVFRVKIWEVADELNRVRSTDAAKTLGWRIASRVSIATFPEFVGSLNSKLSACHQLCVKEKCDSSSDPVVVLASIFFTVAQLGLDSHAASLGGVGEDVKMRIAVQLSAVFDTLVSRVRSYDCWGVETMRRQLEMKFWEGSLKRLRCVGHMAVQTMLDLGRPAEACRVAQKMAEWFFLPALESASAAAVDGGPAGNVTVQNGEPDAFLRCLLLCFHRVLSGEPKGGDVLEAAADLFFATLQVLVAQENCRTSFGSKAVLSKMFASICQIWFKLVAVDEFLPLVRSRYSGGGDGNEPISSLTWNADKFMDWEKAAREVSAALLLGDLDFCLTHSMSRLPLRSRLICYVFESGARFSKRNSDLVTYGKVAARTARAVFFSAAEDDLRDLLWTKVVPALGRALPHLLDFATAKPGLYDSEARRLEADLLTTAAEMQVALWMGEQLRLMERVREEIGWRDALKFAYNHSQPEWKTMNPMEPKGVASKIASCLGLRLSRQAENAKYLTSALENLKKCETQRLKNVPGVYSLVVMLSNLFGLLGMVSEERQTRELQLALAKLNEKSSDVIEASVGLLQANPLDASVTEEMERRVTEEFRKNCRNQKAVDDFVCLRAERAISLLSLPGKTHEVAELLVDTFIELRAEPETLETAPSTTHLLAMSRLNFAAALLEDGILEKNAPFPVPGRLRLIVYSLKFVLNVLTLPAAYDTQLVTYMAATRQYFESLELMVNYAADMLNKRFIESYSVVGWLVAISMGLPYRGVSALAGFCQGLCMSDYSGARLRLLDAFGILYLGHSELVVPPNVEPPKKEEKEPMTTMTTAAAKNPTSRPVKPAKPAGGEAVSVTKAASGRKRADFAAATASSYHTELILDASVRPPSIFVDDDVDDLAFKIKTLNLNHDCEDGDYPEQLEGDDVDVEFFRDRLDSVTRDGVMQFHSLTCFCKLCSVEVLVAGIKTSLLRLNIVLAGGRKDQIRKVIEIARYGEQKILNLCDGDLAKLPVPTVLRQTIGSQSLAIRLFDWLFADADRPSVLRGATAELDWQTLGLVRCGCLPPDATSSFETITFAARIFKGPSEELRRRVFGRRKPEVPGKAETMTDQNVPGTTPERADSAAASTPALAAELDGSGSPPSPAVVAGAGGDRRRRVPAAPFKKKRNGREVFAPPPVPTPAASSAKTPGPVRNGSGRVGGKAGDVPSSVAPQPSQPVKRQGARGGILKLPAASGSDKDKQKEKENHGGRSRRVEFDSCDKAPSPARNGTGTAPDSVKPAKKLPVRTPSRRPLGEKANADDNEPVDMEIDPTIDVPSDNDDDEDVVPATPPPSPPPSARKTRAQKAALRRNMI